MRVPSIASIPAGFVVLLTTMAASAQTPPVPTTPEPPTVAPASDPANASPHTVDTPSTSQPPVPKPREFPAIGGHLGFAMPIATIASTSTAIGADFFTLGVTPGITVHLDEKWAIDFEFIAFNEIKNRTPATTFVVDPGIIRKFDGFVLGTRVATQVGAKPNIGLVPIFVLPFKISERAVYFVELDIPLFLRDDGNKMQASATFLFQSGFGF